MNIRNRVLFQEIEKIPHSKFVLHGSGSVSKLIIPRKPREWHNRDEFMVKRVYGTLLLEVAVFYATIDVSKDRWGWGISKDGLVLKLASLKSLQLRMGYIHVIPREHFKINHHGIMCASKVPVKSVKIFRVSPSLLKTWIAEKYLSIEISGNL